MADPNPQSIAQQLHQAYLGLGALGTPRLDAELLLTFVLNKPRSYLFAWPDRVLTALQTQQFAHLMQRRVAGESVAHICGEKEFWSLALQVTPDTLIPRPDTELLVELVLTKLPATPVQTLADLGTGSGAIVLAIASERPHWQLSATDNSAAALAVAKRNASRLSLNNVNFYTGNWCAALPASSQFNAIISNPPYLAEDDPHLLSGNLAFEPRSALVAGKEGLDDLQQIIRQAHTHLYHQGWLLLEHGYTQALAVQHCMQQAGYSAIATYNDLAGQPRVTVGQWAPAKS